MKRLTIDFPDPQSAANCRTQLLGLASIESVSLEGEGRPSRLSVVSNTRRRLMTSVVKEIIEGLDGKVIVWKPV